MEQSSIRNRHPPPQQKMTTHKPVAKQPRTADAGDIVVKDQKINMESSAASVLAATHDQKTSTELQAPKSTTVVSNSPVNSQKTTLLFNLYPWAAARWETHVNVGDILIVEEEMEAENIPLTKGQSQLSSTYSGKFGHKTYVFMVRNKHNQHKLQLEDSIRHLRIQEGAAYFKIVKGTSLTVYNKIISGTTNSDVCHCWFQLQLNL
jgi:hypothetical protein